MSGYEEVSLDKEEFHMQRAFLYALTIREDVNPEVKVLIEKIEKNLAGLAAVKSVFGSVNAEKTV